MNINKPEEVISERTTAVKAESAMPEEMSLPEALFSLLVVILAIIEFHDSIKILRFFNKKNAIGILICISRLIE